MTLDGDDGVPAGDDNDVDILGNSSDVDIIDLDDYHSAGSTAICTHGLSICRACSILSSLPLECSANQKVEAAVISYKAYMHPCETSN